MLDGTSLILVLTKATSYEESNIFTPFMLVDPTALVLPLFRMTLLAVDN